MNFIKTPAYAAIAKDESLIPFIINRREPTEYEVLIDILYAGVCHSDIHASKNEWGNSIYPMVPGHEMTGKIAKLGSKVTKWKVGDRVGVGTFIDSCRTCEQCQNHNQQYCDNQITWTYNSYEKDCKTPTFGGYSTCITVDENYVFKIPEILPLDKAAPLFCAGITVYSPIMYYKIKAGDKVAVLGMGGLGHMAVKFLFAIGAEVTAIDILANRQEDAFKFGAEDFVLAKDLNKHNNKFDFVINLLSGNNHDYNKDMALLKTDGTMIMLGMPSNPGVLPCFSLLRKRRKIVGSIVGGIKETEQMLDFCAIHNILPEIEIIEMEQINEAYQRMLSGDVKYRFVIDIATFAKKS